MTPAGKLTYLYQFPGPYGQPDAPLIQASDGTFYGTDLDSTGGIVFKMTPDFVVSIVHKFDFHLTRGGYYPYGVVLGPNGNLYGTTYSGGTAGNGVIFELSTDGSFYKVLHAFGDGSVPNDGAGSLAPLVVGPDNNFYGTTDNGGTAGFSTASALAYTCPQDRRHPRDESTLPCTRWMGALLCLARFVHSGIKRPRGACL
jgi:uncharacterized repeat protein (TIGR03803 family)